MTPRSGPPLAAYATLTALFASSHGVLLFGRPRLRGDHADQFVGLVGRVPPFFDY